MRPVGAGAADLVLILTFVLIGRRTHENPADIAGIAGTAWPFVTGAVVGWVVVRAWRRPVAVVSTGLPIWLTTVVAGMALRAASGQGTAASFVVVATLVVGVFLVGWRLLATAVLRQRDQGC